MKTYKFFPCLASCHELISLANTTRGSKLIVVMSDISMSEVPEGLNTPTNQANRQ